MSAHAQYYWNAAVGVQRERTWLPDGPCSSSRGGSASAEAAGDVVLGEDVPRAEKSVRSTAVVGGRNPTNLYSATMTYARDGRA